MFEVSIDGKKVKAEVTFYTAQLYEAEFRSDIIKDLFGEQNAGSVIDFSGDDVIRIDFTKVNWTAMMKVLWAAVKTADDSTPGYTEWMKRTKGLNLWLVQEMIGAEVADCFFRAEAAGEEA